MKKNWVMFFAAFVIGLGAFAQTFDASQKNLGTTRIDISKLKNATDDKNAPVVYFSTEISSQSILRLYNATGKKLTGKVAKATRFACGDTSDKIFLLSMLEASTTGYGFVGYNSYGEGNTRIRVPTDYALANYVFKSNADGYGCYWWLRSPNYNNDYYNRYVGVNGHTNINNNVNNVNVRIVPALKTNR